MGNRGLHEQLGERFVLLDAGGGTVDAITYEVERVSPLRLKEIVQPGGMLHMLS